MGSARRGAIARRWARIASGVGLLSGMVAPVGVVHPAESAGATARAATGPIETVVVTGRKRAERLLDVPAAAVAFDADRLRDESIVDLQELLLRTPGVSTAYLGTTFSNEVIMRGQGSGRMTNSEIATGLYRNGAFITGGNIGGRNLNRLDLFDAERIEVFRGPQGAVFGRNAVGGAINVVSAQPEFDAAAALTARYGSNDRYEVEAVANVPVSERWALRFGGIRVDQQDGFFDNRFDGRELDNQDFTGARVGVRYRPDETLDVVLTTDYLDEAGPSFAVGNYNPLAGGDPYDANDNLRSRFAQDEVTSILQVTRSFPGFDLSSVTFYKTRDAWTRDDLDGFLNLEIPVLADLARYSEDDFTRYGETLHLTSTHSGPWQWLAGVEYLRLEVNFFEETYGFPAFAAFNNSRSLTRSRDDSYALFGSLSYDVTERLTLAGELRYTRDEKAMDLVATNFDLTGTPTTVTERIDKTFNDVSPSLTLSYATGGNAMVYARVASAYRAGGFNNVPDSVTPARFELPYGDEQTISYEVGAKTTVLDQRLMLGAAAYVSRTEDLLVGGRVAVGPAFILYAENGGTGEQAGLELDARYRTPLPALGGDLDIVVGASWMDADIVSGALDGYAIPYSRDWELSVSTTWRRPLSGGVDLFFNHTFAGAWGGWQDEPTDRPLDDIRLHDFGLGLESDRWTLRGTLKNALDEFYNPQRTSATAVRASMPRTWLVSLSVSM